MAKLKECGVSFLDSPTEMLPAALQYLGFKPDSQKPDELKKAEALFLSIRPYTAYFHSSKYISDLANGNLCVAVGYSGDLQQSKARAAEAKNGVTLTYTIPKEGAGSFFDMLAIPADAKNVESAHIFINYLMKPEVIANITNVVQFPNGNKAATPLVDEPIRTDPGIYPNAEDAQEDLHLPGPAGQGAASDDPQLDQDQVRQVSDECPSRSAVRPGRVVTTRQVERRVWMRSWHTKNMRTEIRAHNQDSDYGPGAGVGKHGPGSPCGSFLQLVRLYRRDHPQ